ncbi:hypothetical protein [Flavobacterium sp.]|jgi:hypothetical protein|uniref:hypothetical protein n=1 Tax=Flavobacterium sp. TaxID=239 RepID=UPI0037BE9466
MKKTMLLLFSLLFCLNGKAQASVIKNNILVIVYDVSASVNNASSDELKKSLIKDCKPNTDVAIFLANECSNNAGNTKLFKFISTYKAPTGFRTDAQNKIDLMKKKIVEQNDCKRMLTNVINYLITLNQKSAPKTYLLDLLPKIKESVKEYRNSIDILLISDMQEDSQRIIMKGFANKISAENQAKTLAKRLMDEYSLSNTCFGKVRSIKVIIPKGVSESKMVFTDYFWSSIFSSLGYKKDIIWLRL